MDMDDRMTVSAMPKSEVHHMKHVTIHNVYNKNKDSMYEYFDGLVSSSRSL